MAVQITSKCGGSICTHALLDTGSTHALCTKSLLEELKSEGKRANMSLSTLSSQGEKLETTIRELEVADLQGHHKSSFTACMPLMRFLRRVTAV